MPDEKQTKTWEQHWAEDDTPWDAGKSPPSLYRIIESLKPSPEARALVPGCGRGYDVLTLAHSGYHAVGIDIAPSVLPKFEELRSASELTQEQAHLLIDDFFELTPDEIGTFDLIWDYTFFCAISLSEREKWREQMASLLRPGGTLAMLLFPVVPGAPEDDGPPFPLDPEKVERTLAPRFELTKLESAPASHPGREGKEQLSVWRLR